MSNRQVGLFSNFENSGQLNWNSKPQTPNLQNHDQLTLSQNQPNPIMATEKNNPLKIDFGTESRTRTGKCRENKAAKRRRYKLTDFGISFDSKRGSIVDFGMDMFLAPELYGSSMSNQTVIGCREPNIRSTSESSTCTLWESRW